MVAFTEEYKAPEEDKPVVILIEPPEKVTRLAKAEVERQGSKDFAARLAIFQDGRKFGLISTLGKFNDEDESDPFVRHVSLTPAGHDKPVGKLEAVAIASKMYPEIETWKVFQKFSQPTQSEVVHLWEKT